MGKYLLDTNHLSAAIDDRAKVRERLLALHRAGHRVGTCVPALCELETGLQQTRHRDLNRRILSVLLRHMRVWPLDPPVARVYAETFHDLRARGRVLSQVDMMLVAIARHLDAILLTSDRDFEALPTLRIENGLR